MAPAFLENLGQNLRGAWKSVPSVRHKYETLGGSEDDVRRPQQLEEGRPIGNITESTQALIDAHAKKVRRNRIRNIVVAVMVAIIVLLITSWATFGYSYNASCDTVKTGYICQPKISQSWGQYSPYFSVKSEIPTEVPDKCTITFAQILSRHGARDPTSSKTTAYSNLVSRIHSQATSYGNNYGFIANYNYTLGADQLSVFGQQQMINSGIKYYTRYQSLTKNIIPFIRSSGQDRVVESAQNWTQGFHSARIADSASVHEDNYPYSITVISEDTGSNNTLDHGLCTAFESGAYSNVGTSAQAIYAAIFTPSILTRLNTNLPGVNFTQTEVIYMMDLCPFNTVSNLLGTISPFCSLFTTSEWESYAYYQSLGKYYGFSNGNALGPTQGVGFTNELLARLTSTPVLDHTSTNSTLDSNPETFPIVNTTKLYADFSHDNDMTAIFSALGLYNATQTLSNTTVETTQQTNGYSAAWTVPFAARAYFEKMSCEGVEEEMVRVVVNDRVLPLEICGGDNLGRCKLSFFVDSLSFARKGGEWGQCFV